MSEDTDFYEVNRESVEILRRYLPKLEAECAVRDLYLDDKLKDGDAKWVGVYRQIERAWNDEGRYPEWHRAMQSELRRHWPILTDALDRTRGER